MMLHACALDIRPSVERKHLVRKLRDHAVPMLVLDTCQRLEVFSPIEIRTFDAPIVDVWRNEQAFERLARIAAGLESRILGELEILGQVRCAYKEFHAHFGDDQRRLDRFFQDALSLARRARKQSGIDRQMTSLSGLAVERISHAAAASAITPDRTRLSSEARRAELTAPSRAASESRASVSRAATSSLPLVS